jgi:uncharacterized protein (TIGR02466 family)
MNPQETLRLAISHHNAGRIEEAEHLYRDVLGRWPGHPIASTLLARLALRVGENSKARALLAVAVANAPDYVQAHVALGDCHVGAKNSILAIQSFQRALILAPAQAGPLVSLGNLSQQANDEGSASVLYRWALAIQPGSIAAANNLAAASLKLSDPKAALCAADRVLRNDAFHVRATAYRTVALRALDQGAEADRLIGFGDLVRAFGLDVSQKYQNLTTFNADLATAITTHPNLSSDWDPTQRAIRGGAIVPRLLDHQVPVIEAFETCLRDAIDNAIANLPDAPSHPFLGRKPRLYDLDAWANILGRSDHQSAHIHNLGWMSGVYYVAVPTTESELDENPQAGWIEFNRPGYGIPALSGEAGIEAIQPKPGMLVLFPSYVWHGTIPFESSGERISIAFDLHPRSD